MSTSIPDIPSGRRIDPFTGKPMPTTRTPTSYSSPLAEFLRQGAIQTPPGTTPRTTTSLPPRNIPRGSTNTITYQEIQEGNEMVNFHDEFNHSRFYKKGTYNSLTTPKRNPTTRQEIRPINVGYYRAHLVDPAPVVTAPVPAPAPAPAPAPVPAPALSGTRIPVRIITGSSYYNPVSALLITGRETNVPPNPYPTAVPTVVPTVVPTPVPNTTNTNYRRAIAESEQQTALNNAQRLHDEETLQRALAESATKAEEMREYKLAIRSLNYVIMWQINKKDNDWIDQHSTEFRIATNYFMNHPDKLAAEIPDDVKTELGISLSPPKYLFTKKMTFQYISPLSMIFMSLSYWLLYRFLEVTGEGAEAIDTPRKYLEEIDPISLRNLLEASYPNPRPSRRYPLATIPFFTPQSKISSVRGFLSTLYPSVGNTGTDGVTPSTGATGGVTPGTGATGGVTPGTGATGGVTPSTGGTDPELARRIAEAARKRKEEARRAHLAATEAGSGHGSQGATSAGASSGGSRKKTFRRKQNRRNSTRKNK